MPSLSVGPNAKEIIFQKKKENGDMFPKIALQRTINGILKSDETWSERKTLLRKD